MEFKVDRTEDKDHIDTTYGGLIVAGVAIVIFYEIIRFLVLASIAFMMGAR